MWTKRSITALVATTMALGALTAVGPAVAPHRHGDVNNAVTSNYTTVKSTTLPGTSTDEFHDM